MPEAREAEAFFDRLMAGPLRLDGPDGPEAPSHIGPWVVLDLIGRGGLSVVYDAVRETPGGAQGAALKLAKRPGDETCALFEHEGRLMERLRVPGVVRVLDAGVHDDGRPFLVMERVTGQTVSVVARHQTAWERLLLVWRVCKTVDGLHDEGVVHGDLKPEHFIVRGDGTVVLLDLGLARDLRDPAPVAGQLRLGITPEFAAPEQILGEPITCATDVYALGLVLREVMEGRRRHVPWAFGGEPMTTLDLPDERGAPIPSARRPEGLERYVVDVLQTALQADPSRRYATAGALARALDDVLDEIAGETSLV